MRKTLWVVWFLLSISCALARGSEQNTPINKKRTGDNWEQLKKISLISAIIAQCEFKPPLKNSLELRKFSKSYTNFLIETGKYEKTEVLNMVTEILSEIESRYGIEEIPKNICTDAIATTEEMYIKWKNKEQVVTLN